MIFNNIISNITYIYIYIRIMLLTRERKTFYIIWTDMWRWNNDCINHGWSGREYNHYVIDINMYVMCIIRLSNKQGLLLLVHIYQSSSWVITFSLLWSFRQPTMLPLKSKVNVKWERKYANADYFLSSFINFNINIAHSLSFIFEISCAERVYHSKSNIAKFLETMKAEQNHFLSNIRFSKNVWSCILCGTGRWFVCSFHRSQWI